jgi:hypothetical protein
VPGGLGKPGKPPDVAPLMMAPIRAGSMGAITAWKEPNIMIGPEGMPPGTLGRLPLLPPGAEGAASASIGDARESPIASDSVRDEI